VTICVYIFPGFFLPLSVKKHLVLVTEYNYYYYYYNYYSLAEVFHEDIRLAVILCCSITSPLKGTMKKAPVTLQFTDILSSDPAENAYFADWNIMIRLVPCSGSSYLGASLRHAFFTLYKY